MRQLPWRSVVLGIFFWVTVRQPALALIAVGPTVLVMISVLGTMALLGIPYTLVTSIITAHCRSASASITRFT